MFKMGTDVCGRPLGSLKRLVCEPHGPGPLIWRSGALARNSGVHDRAHLWGQRGDVIECHRWSVASRKGPETVKVEVEIHCRIRTLWWTWKISGFQGDHKRHAWDYPPWGLSTQSCVFN